MRPEFPVFPRQRLLDLVHVLSQRKPVGRVFDLEQKVDVVRHDREAFDRCDAAPLSGEVSDDPRKGRMDGRLLNIAVVAWRVIRGEDPGKLPDVRELLERDHVEERSSVVESWQSAHGKTSYPSDGEKNSTVHAGKQGDSAQNLRTCSFCDRGGWCRPVQHSASSPSRRVLQGRPHPARFGAAIALVGTPRAFPHPERIHPLDKDPAMAKFKPENDTLRATRKPPCAPRGRRGTIRPR